MKRLFGIIVWLFVIGCEDTRLPDCDECVLDIYSSDLQVSDEGSYILEYNQDLAQTYTMLDAVTDCGWSRHLQWDTDYKYLINTDWVSLVNPASMTDENGEAHVMFASWEEFVGHTVTVYCGYTDTCGVHHLDSLKIQIVDNE